MLKEKNFFLDVDSLSQSNLTHQTYRQTVESLWAAGYRGGEEQVRPPPYGHRCSDYNVELELVAAPSAVPFESLNMQMSLCLLLTQSTS